ncbi:TPA: DUF4059 family protein [Streptococcus suis]|uniref:DUF4059 family protein n=1 Tax=Streptococcus suivaginalis TaxID=3028082 RepID=A0AA97A9K2_9STRE|nr:DUF4059 family protein [Streptococcus sp. 29896]MCK4028225.1 DUF4059 family protein [Streptococcus suis]WNY46701.1 DUF4059 family protein [Streptococcus sp. 29896]HEL1585926.1 DUF4059 family protein [Streptococcus suis]HEL2057686.1 DUF4059 family protein [Streptococcus suis]
MIFESILGLYLQSLLLTIVFMVVVSGFWFLGRMIRRVDKTVQERQDALYDLMMINVMTIPILSFGVLGVLLMLKA